MKDTDEEKDFMRATNDQFNNNPKSLNQFASKLTSTTPRRENNIFSRKSTKSGLTSIDNNNTNSRKSEYNNSINQNNGEFDSEEDISVSVFGEELKCGYMMKRRTTKRWKRRWFVLTNDKLYYFKNDKKEELRGCILLNEGFIVLRERDSELDFRLILTKLTKNYLFKAFSKEDKINWVSILKELWRKSLTENKIDDNEVQMMLDDTTPPIERRRGGSFSITPIRTTNFTQLIKKIKKIDNHFPNPSSVISQFENSKSIINGIDSNATDISNRYLFNIYKFEIPLQLTILQNIKMIACGRKHFLFLSDLKDLWACGEGTNGQLGIGSSLSINSPQKILFEKNDEMITQIAAFANQSALLNDKGNLYLWGDLYDGKFPAVKKPTLIKTEKKFLYVSLGDSHVLGLLEDKQTVLGWGVNYYNVLGSSVELKAVRTEENPVTSSFKGGVAMIATNCFNSGVLSKGRIYYWGQNWSPKGKDYFEKLTKLKLANQVIKNFALGKDFVLCVNEEDEVFSLGNGKYGTLGTGIKEPSDVFTNVVFEKTLEMKEEEEKMKNIRPKKRSSTLTTDVTNWKKSNNIPYSEVNFQTNTFSLKESDFLSASTRASKSSFDVSRGCSVSCGSTSAVAIKNGRLYSWGTFFSGEEVSIEIFTPETFPQIEQIPLKQAVCSSGQIFARLGITNRDVIRFSSFDPPEVFAGTLEGLVEYLFHPECTEDFRYAFFSTSNTFATDLEILSTLKQCTNNESKKHRLDKFSIEFITIQIIKALRVWFKKRTFGFDPFENEKLFKETKEFIENLETTQVVKEKLVQLLIRELKPPPPLNESFQQFTSEELTDLVFSRSPKLVAEQFCLTDHYLFKSLLPNEFLGQKWSKQNKRTEAINIVNMIDYFNNCSRWCVTQIVMAKSTKEKNHRYNFFQELLEEFIKLNNYFGATWVQSATSSVHVFKLLSKKLLVSKTKSHQNVLAAYKSLIRNNYSMYRKLLDLCRRSGTPAVPYIGLYLQDLTFIEDGNSDFVEGDTMIHFQKRVKISNVLGQIEDFQNLCYPFKPNYLSKYFLTLNGYSTDELESLMEQTMQDSNRLNFRKQNTDTSLELLMTNKNAQAFMKHPSAEALKRRLELQVFQKKSRKEIWADWVDNFNNNSLVFELPNNECISYRDAFNRSPALELTVESLLERWVSDEEEEKLLKKIFECCFGNNLEDWQLTSLTELLKASSTKSLDQEGRFNLVSSITPIKFFENSPNEKLSLSDFTVEPIQSEKESNSLKNKLFHIEKSVNLLTDVVLFSQSLYPPISPSYFSKWKEDCMNSTDEEEKKWVSLKNQKDSLLEKQGPITDKKPLTENEKKKLKEQLNFLLVQESELKKKLLETQKKIKFVCDSLSDFGDESVSDESSELLQIDSELEKIASNAASLRILVYHISNFTQSYQPLYEKAKNDSLEITQFSLNLIEKYIAPTFEFFISNFQNFEKDLSQSSLSEESFRTLHSNFFSFKKDFIKLSDLCTRFSETVELKSEDSEPIRLYIQNVSTSVKSIHSILQNSMYSSKTDFVDGE